MKKVALLSFALVFAMPVLAQTEHEVEACYKSASNSDAVRQCLKLELQATRQEYRELVDRLADEANELDRIVGKNISEPALNRSNIAFDRYVLEQCQFEQSLLGEGTAASSENFACQINLLQYRMGVIETFLNKRQ